MFALQVRRQKADCVAVKVDSCVVGGSGDHANQEKKKIMKLFD